MRRVKPEGMDRFSEAVEKINALAANPSTDELLWLYGLYKQVTEGDNNNAEPWRIQARQHAKWTAWSENSGMKHSKAIEEYIRFVDFLMAKYE